MKDYTNIERAKNFLYVCDFYGYANGNTYYITKKKTKDGLYHAEHGKDTFSTFTLDEMSEKLKSLQRA
jgi:hypothetical protein